MNAEVESFYDAATSTWTHVVYDRPGGQAAIVDPVLDYDAASARTSTASADRVLAFVHTSNDVICIFYDARIMLAAR